MRALIFAAALLLLPQVALADYLKAPAEEDIPHLTDLELCQHHFVRPMPKIVDEVESRYLKCDRLLEMAKQLKQEKKSEVVKASVSAQQRVLDKARIRADAERRERLELERLALERERLAEQRRQNDIALQSQKQAHNAAQRQASRDDGNTALQVGGFAINALRFLGYGW